MKEILPKKYNPKLVEENIYKLWEKSGFFRPEKSKSNIRKKFVVTIAPPNITGELHMGHALENTLIDIIVRMKRMQGYKVLWVPGIDHAGIAAQNVVEKELAKKNLTRQDIGKEKFLKLMWQWKKRYGSKILEQFKKLGLSVDWSRTRFTLDSDYRKAVNQAFLHYWKKGWIYQGLKVINWCPRCNSSISDLEVEYKQINGKLYYIKYPIIQNKRKKEGQKFITIATTRPETMLGDSAVAVNPNDKRYKSLIGRRVSLPIQNREIPIIADDSVDMNFGTGAVKVTPAHSIIDFEISKRHNLQIFEVIDKNGKMTKEAGEVYYGLPIFECRKRIIEELKKLNLLEKIEDLTHNIGHCSRCSTIIEQIFSKQWFLKMDKLAKLAKNAIKGGIVKFQSKKMAELAIEWLNNIKDWNISRQIWWGHQIPLWFCQDCQKNNQKDDGYFIASISKPKIICQKCRSKNWQRIEDVLDTWFSSALWPFASLGWPDVKKYDYKNYYPTQFISSGRDILYLWIVRMIFSGLELTKKIPFKYVYIHATVLTKDGKRMSKSLGTGIDPLMLIEKYGTDALRFGLTLQTTGLQDLRFNEEVINAGRKFANKIWNATRFVISVLNQGKNYSLILKSNKKLDKIDKEFIEELKRLAKKVKSDIDNFKFAQAIGELYHFFWDRFSAIYIEDSKGKIKQGGKIAENKKQVLLWILANQLKILHPFMPFITEKIWQKLPIKNKKLLIIQDWKIN